MSPLLWNQRQENHMFEASQCCRISSRPARQLSEILKSKFYTSLIAYMIFLNIKKSFLFNEAGHERMYLV